MSKLTGLGMEAYRQFEDCSDYIWKSIDLVEREKRVELEKLSRYFPNDGTPEGIEQSKRLRALRWSREGNKLSYGFPKMIATSNLFLSASMYEYFCLELYHHIKNSELHSIALKKIYLE